MRVNDQTRFLDPTELPMWMNSHERRIAIQLRRVIQDGKPHVRVHSRKGIFQQQPYFVDLVLLAVDEAEMYATLHKPSADLYVNVPFTFILSVWREVADNRWEIAVNGSLFTGRIRTIRHASSRTWEAPEKTRCAPSRSRLCPEEQGQGSLDQQAASPRT